jgi:hypothetical protein
MNAPLDALQSFLDEWSSTEEGNKNAFIHLKDALAVKPGVVLDFLPRAGITYSLRASHGNQKARPLFVMVDIIEDEPRWLSICFFGDMVTDPDEQGDFVPQGLLGEDAVCFDLEEYDVDRLHYIEERMEEAYSSAAGK